MIPALNGSSTLQRFERGNTVEIHNGIIFDFHTGLPHIVISLYTTHTNIVCLIGLVPRPLGRREMAWYGLFVHMCDHFQKNLNLFTFENCW